MNESESGMESSATVLRRRLREKEIIVAPGVFSPIAAMIAARVGFEALYFSGGGFSNAMGLPDLGVMTMTETVQAVRSIIARVNLPLIVDVDTGFGEAVNVARAVGELESANVGALHIEDQVMPKKCGHLPGKQIVSIDEMVKKLVAAKRSSKKGIVLIARTDARSVEGMEAALERAKAYVKAGADVIFPEALESVDEFKEFARRIRVPLLANMTEFGRSPYLTAAEFEQMGYRIVIFPMTAFRTSLRAIESTYDEIMKSGTQKRLLNKMMTREEIYDVIGYHAYEEFDSKSAKDATKILKSR